MNVKDKQILKDSIDVIISNIPALNIAWGLSRALYGAGLKLREQRALEWVEMVRDNPEVFTQEILQQEEFQDGFVFSLEKYLTSRNEEKRRYFRNIFLGYSKNDNKYEFELERFVHVLSQLSLEDIDVLKYVNVKTRNSYQVFDDSKCLSSIYHLINLGILYNDPSSRVGPIEFPFVYTSTLGINFIKYLKNEKCLANKK
ncbi:MAG: hypothetical protein Q8N37_00485 [bacterium]|nr:hypothetical protein [bacterium]